MIQKLEIRDYKKTVDALNTLAQIPIADSKFIHSINMDNPVELENMMRLLQANPRLIDIPILSKLVDHYLTKNQSPLMRNVILKGIEQYPNLLSTNGIPINDYLFSKMLRIAFYPHDVHPTELECVYGQDHNNLLQVLTHIIKKDNAFAHLEKLCRNDEVITKVAQAINQNQGEELKRFGENIVARYMNEESDLETLAKIIAQSPVLKKQLMTQIEHKIVVPNLESTYPKDYVTAVKQQFNNIRSNANLNDLGAMLNSLYLCSQDDNEYWVAGLHYQIKKLSACYPNADFKTPNDWLKLHCKSTALSEDEQKQRLLALYALAGQPSRVKDIHSFELWHAMIDKVGLTILKHMQQFYKDNPSEAKNDLNLALDLSDEKIEQDNVTVGHVRKIKSHIEIILTSNPDLANESNLNQMAQKNPQLLKEMVGIWLKSNSDLARAPALKNLISEIQNNSFSGSLTDKIEILLLVLQACPEKHNQCQDAIAHLLLNHPNSLTSIDVLAIQKIIASHPSLITKELFNQLLTQESKANPLEHIIKNASELITNNTELLNYTTLEKIIAANQELGNANDIINNDVEKRLVRYTEFLKSDGTLIATVEEMNRAQFKAAIQLVETNKEAFTSQLFNQIMALNFPSFSHRKYEIANDWLMASLDVNPKLANQSNFLSALNSSHTENIVPAMNKMLEMNPKLANRDNLLLLLKSKNIESMAPVINKMLIASKEPLSFDLIDYLMQHPSDTRVCQAIPSVTRFLVPSDWDNYMSSLFFLKRWAMQLFPTSNMKLVTQQLISGIAHQAPMEDTGNLTVSIIEALEKERDLTNPRFPGLLEKILLDDKLSARDLQRVFALVIKAQYSLDDKMSSHIKQLILNSNADFTPERFEQFKTLNLFIKNNVTPSLDSDFINRLIEKTSSPSLMYQLVVSINQSHPNSKQLQEIIAAHLNKTEIWSLHHYALAAVIKLHTPEVLIKGLTQALDDAKSSDNTNRLSHEHFEGLNNLFLTIPPESSLKLSLTDDILKRLLQAEVEQDSKEDFDLLCGGLLKRCDFSKNKNVLNDEACKNRLEELGIPLNLNQAHPPEGEVKDNRRENELPKTPLSKESLIAVKQSDDDQTAELDNMRVFKN